jgi:hypothetical protein
MVEGLPSKCEALNSNTVPTTTTTTTTTKNKSGET